MPRQGATWSRTLCAAPVPRRPELAVEVLKKYPGPARHFDAMRPSPTTFEIRGRFDLRFRESLGRHLERNAACEGGLLLCSEALRPWAEELLRWVAAGSGSTWLVAFAPVVFSERGALEREPGLVGMVLPPTARLVPYEHADENMGADLAHQLGTEANAFVLMSGDDRRFASWLERFSEVHRGDTPPIFGGTSVSAKSLFLVRQRTLWSGEAVALLLPRPPKIRSSTGCRLLTPLHTVTGLVHGRSSSVDECLLSELEDVPALSRLTDLHPSTEGEAAPVVLAVAAHETPFRVSGRAISARSILGVDPSRNALLVRGPLELDTKVAFALLDARSARQDFEAHLTDLAKSSAGAAPAFAFLVSSVARGRALYGSADVDLRLIQARFPGLPLLGLASKTEWVTFDTRLVEQIYSATLAVYYAPS